MAERDRDRSLDAEKGDWEVGKMCECATEGLQLYVTYMHWTNKFKIKLNGLARLPELTLLTAQRWRSYFPHSGSYACGLRTGSALRNPASEV